MSGERMKRVARNQAMYRQVNERLEDLNEALGEISREFRVVCECSDVLCMEQFTVSREVYERTRANSAQFIISRGHQAVGVEKVVEPHITGPGKGRTDAEAKITVYSDGQWLMHLDPPRQMRGPDADSLKLWIGRMYDHFVAEAKAEEAKALKGST